ncbi:MAG: rhodanese-like domain-containing protein [Peptococcaceae bacterium]|nr:rhodanese-like domain-containing protein [Peptococcaceae bacterium]
MWNLSQRHIKSWTFICVMILCACVFSACSSKRLDAPSVPDSDNTAVYQKITAKEAKEMMDSGKPYILLDVRTNEEYAEKRIDGALLIPNYEIAERAAVELPDQSALILVYCRSGGRSAAAALELIGMGYTNVYDLGGINNWPFETVSG